MIFESIKYDIKKQNDNKLIISLNKKHLITRVASLFAFDLVLLYIMWNKIDFNSINLIFVGFVLLIITSLFQIIKDLKMYQSGKEYVFNKIKNTIHLNEKLIGKLKGISAIEIIEDEGADEENSTFQLCLSSEDFDSIFFSKSENFKNIESVALAISKITNVEFKFKSSIELLELESENEKAIQHQEFVKSFEEKFKDKTLDELNYISNSTEFREYCTCGTIHL